MAIYARLLINIVYFVIGVRYIAPLMLYSDNLLVFVLGIAYTLSIPMCIYYVNKNFINNLIDDILTW